MDFGEAKRELKKLLKLTRPEHVGRLLHWVTSSEEVVCLLKDNRCVILENISEELRSFLPPDAMTPSETFTQQQMEERARGLVHVDGFLYDENLLDSMCEEGTFSRNICLECGSTRTRELEFLSHSFSVPELRFLFLSVLPDLSGRVLVDVGSRLGAVLYAGHVFSSASRLVGLELNQDFVTLQNRVIHKYGFGDRVQVDLVQNADVLVMNNVFEFFLEPPEQIRCWRFLVQNFRKKGSLLVTVPGLDESFRQIQETLPCDWLEELPVNYDLYLTSDSAQNEAFRQIHLYRVM
ncbi:uncharacterized protein zgc:109986 isoform X2 [Boleophthalmus pectinirostris]|uniref:uncharacterized protein zgc:109986 isoform X2 n=1 Tax=Boleophthalmus pectinirostris TaxID=150288 RepID=UPI00242E4122|nr:uncharacterized protein zgc:109986 isoform X2 [Boleophthalmus pectinirostris]